MFLDMHSLNLPSSLMHSFSDDESDRLASAASHVCPNCDGAISNDEHEHLGVCGGCYYGDSGTAMGH